jgi:hypothetical protein
MIIIDFEGYKINEKFIFKEFASFNLDNKNTLHYFVKSPYFYIDIQTNWVYNNIHHIPLSFGNTNINKLYDIINSREFILVKGREKTRIIKNLSKQSDKIIDLELLGCPKYSEKHTINCSYEPHNLSNFNHCALKKTLFFKDWFIAKNEASSGEYRFPQGTV